MKYVAVLWPDVQEYMSIPEFSQENYFDSRKNVWLIPEEWVNDNK